MPARRRVSHVAGAQVGGDVVMPLPDNPGTQFATDPIPEVAERETESRKQQAIKQLQAGPVDGFLLMHWKDDQLSVVGAGDSEFQLKALVLVTDRVIAAEAKADELSDEAQS